MRGASSLLLVVSLSSLLLVHAQLWISDTSPCLGGSGPSVDVVVSSNPAVPASNGIFAQLLLVRFTSTFTDTSFDFSGSLSFRLCGNSRYRVGLTLDSTKRDALYASVGNVELSLQVSVNSRLVGSKFFNSSTLEIAFSTPPAGKTAADCDIDALLLTDRPSSTFLRSEDSDWLQFTDDTFSESVFNAENLCGFQKHVFSFEGAQTNLFQIQEVNFRGLVLSQNATQFSFSPVTSTPTSAPAPTSPTSAPATSTPSGSGEATTAAPAQDNTISGGLSPLYFGAIIAGVLLLLVIVAGIAMYVVQRRRRKSKLDSSFNSSKPSTELVTKGLVSKGANFA